MSHVIMAKTKQGEPLITCLESVKLAAKNLGLEVHERSTYHWYGRSVGDWKIPEGWTAADMGRNAVLVLSAGPDCRKKHGMHSAYEMAIIPDKKNPGAYTVMYDFYGPGRELEKVIGKPVVDYRTQEAEAVAPEFVKHYRMCADALSAAELGEEITFEQEADGSWTSYTVPNETRMRESGY